MSRVSSSKPEQYRDYRAEIESERLARSLRVGCAIVAILSTAFIPMDYAVFRERFAPMLGFRLFCNAVMGAIIFWGARARPLQSAVVGSLTTGAMLVMVISAAGGVTSDYTPGLMLLFLGMPVLLPFTASQAGFIVLVLTVGLALVPVLGGAPIRIESYGVHLIFPIAAGIESVAASALLDRLRFADFLRRREVEEARDELKELDREKSRFTANVHHELRTPLTLMLAPVDGLLAGTFGDIPDLPRSYLKSVHANGQRLLKLINNLLDLAKIEDKKFQIHRREVDLTRLVEDYVASARPLAEQKNVRLSTEWGAETPSVFVDPDAMEKVIGNLLGNALKFTDDGGGILIKGSGNERGGFDLCVKDTGIGIPKEKLDDVFDRFAQVDTSSTRKYEGTGIGLSLVFELISLHGGRVWAKSDGVGHGTEMHVSVPLGAPDESVDDLIVEEEVNNTRSAARKERAQSASLDDSLRERELSLSEMSRNINRGNRDTGSGNFDRQSCPEGAARVLVVEDNNDMRRLMSFLVGSEFEVRTARNGREGLEAVQEFSPDLVLTDVMMPEMSGIELCKTIKSSPKTRMIPVVLVTSKADREMKIQGLDLGADDYVTKPFHPSELLARVRSLLRVSGLQRMVSEKNDSLERINSELKAALRDLKEAESALVQSERLAAVGELAAGVAHEVNNPVNFATNALKTLSEYVSDVCDVASKVNCIDFTDRHQLEKKIGDLAALKEKLEFDEISDALEELVGIVTEGLDRTQRLVGDLQHFASPGMKETGRVNLGESIESTMQLVRYSARERKVKLHLDVGRNVPSVHGCRQSLNQVFLNLVKNAIEAAAPSEGNVWVSLSRAGKDVVVEVADDGAGIAADDAGRVFEPFFSTKAAGSGTGLGLSISRRVIGDHKGEISFHPRDAGGAVFSVSVPALSAEGSDVNEA